MKKNIINLFAIVFILLVVALAIKGFLLYRSGVRVAIIHPAPTPINSVPDTLLKAEHRAPVNLNVTPPTTTTKTRETTDIMAEIIYTAKGTIDSSNWEESRSEYGGYRVMSPQKMTSFGCIGHGCEPQLHGEPFRYLLAHDDGIGVAGMDINIIKKNYNTNLNDWINNYVISDTSGISGVQKTKISNYPALQFDVHIKDNDSPIFIKYAVYPYGSENTLNIGGYDAITYRYYIIDLENRYAVISHSLSINDNNLIWNTTDLKYLGPRALNNKILSDIYAEILNSFQAFPPTES